MKKEGGREAYQKKDEGEKGEKNGVKNEGWRDAKKRNDSVGLKTPLKRGRCTGISFLM